MLDTGTLSALEATATAVAAAEPRERARRQDRTPYLDALRAHCERDTTRLHVPGHKGGAGADPALVQALGPHALELDLPSHIRGVDVGPSPTPLEQAQELAAEAWGADRTWFLTNGASQGNQAACLAVAQAGDEIIVQGNVHTSTIDGLILSGLWPIFVNPEVDAELGIAHGITPEALDRALRERPRAVAAMVVSPTYYGVCADLEGLAAVAHAHSVPLIVDEAWGGHLAFSDALPSDALSAGADLVVSSTHKVVGSLTQSAMLHLAQDPIGGLDRRSIARAVRLVESTSPSALLLGSLDAARRNAAVNGARLLEDAIEGMDSLRAAIRAIPGIDVLDERLCGRPGAHAYDHLSLAIDLNGSGTTGYDLDRLMYALDGIDLELVQTQMVVALFGMAEPVTERGAPLVEALAATIGHTNGNGNGHLRRPAYTPGPCRGPLVMSPRDAFLGPTECVPVTDACGRIAAESLMAYPPGIPAVLPGERLTAEIVDHCREVLDRGGYLRGASDPSLRSVMVVAERHGHIPG